MKYSPSKYKTYEPRAEVHRFWTLLDKYIFCCWESALSWEYPPWCSRYMPDAPRLVLLYYRKGTVHEFFWVSVYKPVERESLDSIPPFVIFIALLLYVFHLLFLVTTSIKTLVRCRAPTYIQPCWLLLRTVELLDNPCQWCTEITKLENIF